MDAGAGVGLGLRSDIQFLRGIAVLLVVASHAFHTWLPYGDLGVDIFFVISGFLMTKMIVTDLDRGRFSFREFYLRRARRLLPASLATLAVTFGFAWAFLPAEAWPSFGWQFVGALTFTANIPAQLQIHQDHLLQPISHYWSLSLEEQFYLLFPLFLWATPKQFRVVGVAVIAGQSFLALLLTNPNYLLPTRGWELLAGGLAYFHRGTFVAPWGKWAAFATVPVAVAFDVMPLAVGAAVIMLMGEDGWVRVPPIERIGDWSYSLYLVHWPLIAFAAIYYSAPPPPLIAGLLCVAAIGLAAFQYRYIEEPWRRRKESGLERAPLLGTVVGP